jgi:phage terminase large subunit
VSTARALLDRYAADPVAFFAEVLKFTPYSRQREIAEAVRDHDRVAVRACNASGKTALAGALVLWWLAGGPGSIVVSTAMTERQLRKVLWRAVHQHYRHARSFFHGATVSDVEIFLGPDWFATGLATDETEGLQGYHGSRVLVIVDEASGVDERIFEAVEGLLAGGEAKLLLIGNPLRTSGTFYDAFTKDRELWKLITISAHETPNFTGERVSREARSKLASVKFEQRLKAGRGVDSNEYQVRVLGQFPSESEDTVVSLGDLQRAQAQSFEAGLPLVIGGDIARFGSDSTVLAVREGNRIRVVDAYQGRDLMRTSGAVTALARRLHGATGHKPTIVIDDVGLGGGVTDRLRELNEFKVVAFNGGKSSSSRDFPNRRSQLWFSFADVLPVLDLDPADEELAADLLAPSYTLSSSAQRVVEPKSNTRKRLRRSPDRADAVMLTIVVEPPLRPGAAAKRGGTIHSVARVQIPGIRRVRDPLAERLHAAGIAQVGSQQDGIGELASYLAPSASEPAQAAVAHDVLIHDPAAELQGYPQGGPVSANVLVYATERARRDASDPHSRTDATRRPFAWYIGRRVLCAKAGRTRFRASSALPRLVDRPAPRRHRVPRRLLPCC